MKPTLSPGKLPPRLLGRLLATLPTDDPLLLVGPTVGEDAAVIDFAPGSATLLAAKVDPITFATDEIGYYAVNVCANDIAVAGGVPRYYFPTLLLPAGSTDEDVAERIFAQIATACRALEIVVAGGHSEVTRAVNQPVVAGAMLGSVERGRLVSSGGARPGQVVLLAGDVPIEGASIIARERRDDLLRRGWGADEVDTAARMLFEPGISVLGRARIAMQTGLVTAMHDPTEGGVITALREMAAASGVGLTVHLDAIPVPEIARRLCAEYGVDPLGAIASGALLAACAPESVAELLGAWRDAGWSGCAIGKVTPATEGLVAFDGSTRVPFPEYAVDELTRLWQE